MDVREHGVPACSTSCFAFDNVTVFVALIAISHDEGDKVCFGREVLGGGQFDYLFFLVCLVLCHGPLPRVVRQDISWPVLV